MDENLRNIFAIVNDWLRFLEAKHTALIALNGAAVLALVQSLEDIGNASLKLIITYYLFPGLLIALLISLFSMTQWATKIITFRRKKRLNAPNALYFGYISALDKAAFRSELTRLGCIPSPVSDLDNALIEQIHINARIAFAKQRLFHWAITCTFFTIVICFTVFWFTRWFCKIY